MTTTTSVPSKLSASTVAGHDVDPDAPLLQVEDLRVEFTMPTGTVVANDRVNYQLDAGETLAILGESGSGKSVSAQAVMGIIDSPPGAITGGAVRYRGIDLLQLPEKDRRKVRGDHISIIFQDALTALNPVYTVGFQIAEMLRVHRGTSKSEARKVAVDLMDRVKIPSARERLDAYPHEFSGGMRQRVMIAMSLALDPAVLIADEPTTALDVTVQAQVMDLLAELQAETGMGLILITHDLGVVAEVADRVAVMYAGRIVETGEIDDVYHTPTHPYTIGLMESLPQLDVKGGRLRPIPGSPPDLTRRPSGCAFHPRCRFAQQVCVDKDPELRIPAASMVDDDRLAACHFSEEIVDAQ
ncbi:ABC transporter ATP-binding protein [Salsipaludibacter albus]|uniref:ABC transporter ATP-binding protein n=1 Tax=Salsipaludibacter albus TaxID=2849650 RepID=UPI001EE4ACDA|nr:ABC transporter ATP-binding protein [Salsipaludibacter albus]MBY5161689.1 ABC transporter ATP-binding protein [Salsipaludibacter albus]